MNNHKVKAFTIIEVTITMVIAAILIAITYTSYSIVSKSYLSFNTKNDDMAVLERMDKLLKRDFMRAETIQRDSSGILFKNTNSIIQYEFNPDFIIRISGRSDTFKVKSDSLNMLFEGQPVSETDPSNEQRRLDGLEINVEFQNEKIPYHYHKQYSSSDLIKRNTNAIH